MAGLTLEGVELATDDGKRKTLDRSCAELFRYFDDNRGKVASEDRLLGVLSQRKLTATPIALSGAMGKLCAALEHFGYGDWLQRVQAYGWMYKPSVSRGPQQSGVDDGWSQADPIVPGSPRPRQRFFFPPVDFARVREAENRRKTGQ